MSNEIDEELLEQEDDSARQNMFMTFKCGKESFGIEIKYVEEIIQFQAITPVPEVESYIKGLINLRGKIVPVIDVRMRFGQEPLPYTDRTCIIVITVKNVTVGLIIESIAKVVTIDSGNILPPPTLSHGAEQNKYVYGIGKIGDEVKLLLNPEKLICEVDMEELLASDEEQE